MADQKENQEHRNEPNDSPLLLSAHKDYLGQWLAILGEQYPQEMTELAIVGYRLALRDLTPHQLDLAFSAALKAECAFRPSAGQIRGYLREARRELNAAEIRALPEAQLTDEEAVEVFNDIRERAEAAGPSLLAQHDAIKKAREEIAALRAEPDTGKGVIEITDEMRTEHERKKAEALKRFGEKRGA